MDLAALSQKYFMGEDAVMAFCLLQLHLRAGITPPPAVSGAMLVTMARCLGSRAEKAASGTAGVV